MAIYGHYGTIAIYGNTALMLIVMLDVSSVMIVLIIIGEGIN
jgi:hypothetical protein